MVEVRFDNKFSNIFSKVKNELLRIKIEKQISKISENSKVGKPMMYDRKGTRSVH